MTATAAEPPTKPRRAPWFDDDHAYALLEFDGEGARLRRSRRSDFPRWVHDNSFNRMLNKGFGYTRRLRCFLTNAECAIAHEELMEATSGIVPWAATVEHLVPVRHMQYHGERAVQCMRNIAIMSSFANQMLNHKPLALKLFHRRRIQEAGIDLEFMSSETIKAVRRCIIDGEEPFRRKGRLPWQPHTFEAGDPGLAPSEDFFQRLIEIEREFLSLTTISEREGWLDQFDPLKEFRFYQEDDK